MASQDLHIAYDMHEKLNCLGVTENAIDLEKVFVITQILIMHVVILHRCVRDL